MQRSTPTLPTLLGTLLLSAGIATPLALADEPTQEQDPQPKESVSSTADADTSGNKGADERENADLVEVRVSLPDGRTFVRLEPKRNMSARYRPQSSAPRSTSRNLPDGSRISVGSHGVSGGSNAGSSSVGSSGGGGGGGSSSAASGGGGGGGGSSASSSGAGAPAAAKAEMSGERSGGGVFSYGEGNSSSGAGSNSSGATPRPVPTIGEPNYDRDGNASGGQRVEFHEAGMSAAVIGNRVYFNGVEMVSANAPFEVITGTRFATDSVIMYGQRLDSSADDLLTSFNTRNSGIKIEMESDTVVDLVLFTPSGDPNNPERVQRTWTVRIR